MSFVLQVFELSHDDLRAGLGGSGGGAAAQEVVERLAGEAGGAPMSPAAEVHVVDFVQGRGNHFGDVIGSDIALFVSFWNLLSRQLQMPDLAEALLWGTIAGIPCSGDPGWGGLGRQRVADLKAKLAQFETSTIDASAVYDSEAGLYGDFILDWLGDLDHALDRADGDVVTLLL